ncbi:TetR/AcrR family transcriptional regulator [filamentous cyanobacterium LEGE 11480]|uniref:TetR/AcrR family transcriptional regulator n=1 Tax=Romeriopsis navalis LEGE 11480 TaxID=2777977 RepID=A0A928Z2L0_9CYAN|nr:TetR/AcrR family transcriptional regulator [Romeriopsis navalis]MBE9030496.1 TetR/AcrR family transcriptional regulator [Romeriopsis navalis LEGE 11480]
MENNTAKKILDVAQEMVRTRGYSAFSYADISKQVGIRKASIHYHFASKDDLVEALVKGYQEKVQRAGDRIAKSNATPGERVVEFANLYRSGLADNQICLCAMLAADFDVLPQPIRDEVQVFFRQIETCLTSLLQQGVDAQLWVCHPSVEHEAKGLIALLQGAQLLARSSADRTATFEQMVYPLLNAKFPVG